MKKLNSDAHAADVAKLSSSSFSSAMSSGITTVGSSSSGVGVEGASSERKRRSDSGEMSRVRLPSEAMLTVSSIIDVTDDAGVSGRSAMQRPRSLSVLLARNERNRFQDGVGDAERAMSPGDAERAGSSAGARKRAGAEPTRAGGCGQNASGARGGGRGLTNRSFGFMVL